MTTDLTARYVQAEAMLPPHLKAKIRSPQVRPTWFPGTDSFWYAEVTGAGVEYLVVDAAAQTRAPAFDQAAVADALAAALGIPVAAGALPVSAIERADDAVIVSAYGLRLSVAGAQVSVLGTAPTEEAASPDGRWGVSIKDFNVHLRDRYTDESRQLTTDGTAGYTYGGAVGAVSALVLKQNLGIQAPPLLAWSPDSSRFVISRLDERACGLMHLVRSTPPDGGRPRPLSYTYPLVGDADETLPTATYHVVDVTSGQVTAAKKEPVLEHFVSPFGYGFIWWSADSSKVFFINTDRGDKSYWLNALDPVTGDVEVLFQESMPTHVTVGPQHQLREARTLASGEVLWWSQRTDWGHLWLWKPDGSWAQLTSGDWQVRHIVSVDEEARRVVFTAAGRLPGSDPYMAEIASVSLDGGEITTITADGLDHDPAPSPSGRFFVDVTSRFDTPTVSVLRDRSGAVVMELGRADASELYAAGWSPAERVVVKAADGVTDIYCAVYKPRDFDPTKKYPVVEEVYPGPQVQTIRLRFPGSGGLLQLERNLEQFAALGFVGVAVDARGTALRSKSFQDHVRLGQQDDILDDHVEALRQLAETRPWMDLDRVGITGHSGGGWMSARAMLVRPDFYKAAVCFAGDHDDRVNHAWWGEKWFGLVDEFDFEHHANPTHAANLRGKLMIVHGEMDDNAVPHGAMRLVDALMRANKDFDLVIVPNQDHFLYTHNAYIVRRRWDFFVQHLLGETPPDYEVAEVPLSLGG